MYKIVWLYEDDKGEQAKGEREGFSSFNEAHTALYGPEGPSCYCGEVRSCEPIDADF